MLMAIALKTEIRITNSNKYLGDKFSTFLKGLPCWEDT